jgi:hypothetical protein
MPDTEANPRALADLRVGGEVQLSNRFQFVPRQRLRGAVQGVDFGPNIHVIARSPTAALIWDSGHSYRSGNETVYGASELTGLVGLSECWGSNPKWIRLGVENGRLSITRVEAVANKISELFDDEARPLIVRAVRERSTLLIEGGGTHLPATWTQEPGASARRKKLLAEQKAAARLAQLKRDLRRARAEARERVKKYVEEATRLKVTVPALPDDVELTLADLAAIVEMAGEV